jgi:O-antigen/teichoic acid export membrane protein
MEQNSETGKAVRSAFVWNLANQGVSQLVSAAVFIYVANKLDPFVFGIFALAVLIVDAFAHEAKIALVDVILIKRDFSRTNLSGILYAALAAAVFAYLALAFVVPVVPWPNKPAELGSFVSALALTVLIAPFSAVLEAVALRDLQFRAMAARNIATSLCSGAAAVLAIVLGAGEWALVVQRLVAVTVGVLVLLGLVRWWPAAAFDARAVRSMVTPFLKIWFGQMIVFALARVVDLIVGLRFGVGSLGLYRVATRLVDLVQSASSAPLTGVFVPVLSKYADEPARRRGHYLQIVAVSALVTAPLLSGLAVLSYDIVDVVLSDAYAGSGPILAIMAMVGLIAPFAHFRSVALVGAGRPGISALLSLADLATTTALALLGSQYGLQGTVVGVLGSAWIAAIVTSLVLRRTLGIALPQLLRACGPPYLAAVVMATTLAGAGFAFQTWSSVWRLGVLVPLGGVVFFAWLLVAHRPWLLARFVYLKGTASHAGETRELV